jgi:hypothetical protein
MSKRKRKPRQFKTVDWTELEKGDVIKLIGGHGPYMMIDGQRHNIGVPPGQYKVRKLDDNGIHALRGINHFFIYMGEEKESAIGVSAPHKFKKVLTKPEILV